MCIRYELASYLTCWYIKGKIIYWIEAFEVTLHTGDRNEATRFIFLTDLERLF